jgi:hypothetical protein
VRRNNGVVKPLLQFEFGPDGAEIHPGRNEPFIWNSACGDPILIECAFFGKEARFHHVGLAVESVRELIPVSEIVTEETQRVSLASCCLMGSPSSSPNLPAITRLFPGACALR